MRYFAKDHPRCRSPVGCMSCDEIRYWLVALRKEHGWKLMALVRFLGLPDGGALRSKLRASWIYPGEQLRMSRQIGRIISGEVVCQPLGRNRWEAVIADSPQPLRHQGRWAINIQTGRIGYIARCVVARGTGIPSFTALGG
jgi:hypothetical protein